jgi:hypothetical protein
MHGCSGRWLPLLTLLFGLLPICSAQSANLREQHDAYARGTTLWNQIRTTLAEHGQSYFENLKDAAIPPHARPETLFVGTVIALDSNERPSLLLLSMDASHAPEISLQITYSSKHPKLSQPVAVGMKVAFEGTIVRYTGSPFILYMDAHRLSFFPKADIREGDCFMDVWCPKMYGAPRSTTPRKRKTSMRLGCYKPMPGPFHSVIRSRLQAFDDRVVTYGSRAGIGLPRFSLPVVIWKFGFHTTVS